MAYLDDTGLAYFWGKIKAWANSVFALISHTHASSDVNLMTGYSMPSSTGAISSGDTLNQAVGKLEKALDAADITNVVHRTGDESISGLKYFTNTVRAAEFVIKRSDFVKGTVPSSVLYFYFAAYDKDAIDYAASCVGLFEVSIDENNVTRAYVRSIDNVANSNTYSQITCVSDPTNNSHYVTSNVNIEVFKSSPSFRCHYSNLARGTAPSESFYGFPLRLQDSAGGSFGGLYHTYETSKNNSVALLCYKGLDTTNTFATLGVGYSDSGNAYSWAVTPAANSNNNYIATTKWVNDKGYLTQHQSLSNYVTLNTAQTITGRKTFTAISANNYDMPHASANKGTNPSSQLYWHIYATDKNGLAYSNALGLFEVTLQTDGITGAYLRALKNTSGSTVSSTMGVFYNTSGSSAYATCPSLHPYAGATCGTSGNKWSAVWATNGTIQTSDERVKEDIASIPDAVLDAWEQVEWVQFRMKDAVRSKGSGARLHSGIVAQRVRKAFDSAGVDPSRYGFFCWDEWEASDAVFDSSGAEVVPRIEAGEQYSVRYDEALALEAACMRRENARLKKRVSDLEERLAALELRLGSE